MGRQLLPAAIELAALAAPALAQPAAPAATARLLVRGVVRFLQKRQKVDLATSASASTAAHVVSDLGIGSVAESALQ